jgi:hypothetical protein
MSVVSCPSDRQADPRKRLKRNDLDDKQAPPRRLRIRRHQCDRIEGRHQRIDLGGARRLLRADDGIALRLDASVSHRPGHQGLTVMPPTEPRLVQLREVFGHPDDPMFAGVRAELGWLFILHKADLRLGEWTDAQVIDRANDITATLIGCGQAAPAAR